MAQHGIQVKQTVIALNADSSQVIEQKARMYQRLDDAHLFITGTSQDAAVVANISGKPALSMSNDVLLQPNRIVF